MKKTSADSLFTEFSWKPAPEPEPRTRRKHNKSFNGCLACKQRRVRCSEERPSCSRCSRTNTTCEYKALRVWMFDPGTSTTERAVSRPTLRMVTPSSPFSLFDRRALSYYEERAAPIFSGYFGRSFFDSLVLQMSNQQPLVRDALVGAATVIESLEVTDQAAKARLQAEFYNTYNKVIAGIASPSRKPSSEVLLTVCALFVCYELVQGYIDRGITHVKAGFNIIQSRLKWLEEHGQSNKSEAIFLREQMQPIMAGFAIQAYIYGTSLLSPPQISHIASQRYEPPHVPQNFANIVQAYHCLSGIIHHIAITDAVPEHEFDKKYLKEWEGLLGEWTRAIDGYEHKLDAPKLAAEHGDISVLRLNLDMARVVLKVLALDLAESPSTTDILRVEYSQILQSYRSLWPSTVNNLSSLGGTSKPSVVEAIPPLFIIAITTSEEQQEQEAITLLETLDRTEANWSSRQAAQIAKQVSLRRTLTLPSPETEDSFVQAQESVPPVCLHTASIQWSLSRCIPKICLDPAVLELFDRCPCKSHTESVITELPANLPS